MWGHTAFPTFCHDVRDCRHAPSRQSGPGAPRPSATRPAAASPYLPPLAQLLPSGRALSDRETVCYRASMNWVLPLPLLLFAGTVAVWARGSTRSCSERRLAFRNVGVATTRGIHLIPWRFLRGEVTDLPDQRRRSSRSSSSQLVRVPTRPAPLTGREREVPRLVVARSSWSRLAGISCAGKARARGCPCSRPGCA